MLSESVCAHWQLIYHYKLVQKGEFSVSWPALSSVLQARGPKKHLKRVAAPKHWMLDKLTGVFVSKLTSISYKNRGWMKYYQLNWMKLIGCVCLIDLFHYSVTVEALRNSKQKCFVSISFESNSSSHVNISHSPSPSRLLVPPPVPTSWGSACLSSSSWGTAWSTRWRATKWRRSACRGSSRSTAKSVLISPTLLGSWVSLEILLFFSPSWSRLDVKPSGRGCS